jgi:hypothetical protein
MSAEKQRSVKKKPVFLQAAEAFYGAAFDHRSRRELAQAMREWGRLDDSEQRFAVAHLLFLNLQAQGEVVRVLGAVRRTAEDIADSFEQALEPPLEDGVVSEDGAPASQLEWPQLDQSDAGEGATGPGLSPA